MPDEPDYRVDADTVGAVGPGATAHFGIPPEQLPDIVRQVGQMLIEQFRAAIPEQIRAEVERALREKAPQVGQVLTPASTEVSIGGDATGNVVISTASGDIHLSLVERQAIRQAVPYVIDADQRVPLALTGMAVDENLAPPPDPAALLLQQLAGRLEQGR